VGAALRKLFRWLLWRDADESAVRRATILAAELVREAGVLSFVFSALDHFLEPGKMPVALLMMIQVGSVGMMFVGVRMGATSREPRDR
jgi:hypothetical protein